MNCLKRSFNVLMQLVQCIPSPFLFPSVSCRYEAAMREANACDFDDLIGLPVALLRQNRGLLARVRKTFK